MGVVNTQYTFAANDVITSTKMNDIIDQTTVTDDAILGNTLEVAGGKLKVRAQGITSNELATNAVTNTQITNNSVTYDKLGAGGPSWDGNGVLYSNGHRISSIAPVLNFNETDTGKQWFWVADGGGFSLRFNDYNTYALGVDGVGTVTFFQNATTNGTSTVNGAASFASTASFGGNVSFNSGAITAKGYASSDSKGVLFLGNASNGYIYNNGTSLEFSSPTGGISYLSSSGTIWQSGNDGAGSGLDADLLDGMQPSALQAANTIVKRDGAGDSGFRSISADVEIISYSGRIKSEGYGGFPARGAIFLGTNESGYVYNNGSTLEFRSPTGGLSYLSSSGTIWTSGNDGAGSGLDADLLDGLQPTELNVGNTIVKRNVNGDFNAGGVSLGSLSVTNVIGGTTSGNIKQGGGSDQLGNVIYMGWRSDSTLGVQVDSTSFGNNWPINVTGSSSSSTTSGTASVANSVINGSISASKLSGVQIGSAPIYGARALGVIALTPTGRTMYGSGGNIASVTRIDPTHTQVNFAVNMPYTNYVVSGCVFNDANLEFATFEHNVDNFKIRHSSDTVGRNIQFVVFA